VAAGPAAPCVICRGVAAEVVSVDTCNPMSADPPDAAVVSPTVKQACVLEVWAQLKIVGKLPCASVTDAEFAASDDTL